MAALKCILNVWSRDTGLASSWFAGFPATSTAQQEACRRGAGGADSPATREAAPGPAGNLREGAVAARADEGNFVAQLVDAATVARQ